MPRAGTQVWELQQGIRHAAPSRRVFNASPDGVTGTLVDRVWRPDLNGPSVVIVRDDGVYDISQVSPTVRDLCEADEAASLAQSASGTRLGSLQSAFWPTPPVSAEMFSALGSLPPIDLQVIKAAGVTFAVSMLERVVEEHFVRKARRADQPGCPMFRCRAVGFRHCRSHAQPSTSKVDLTALCSGAAASQR